MTRKTSAPHGTEGTVERVYWRGEEPWVRIRSREGKFSVPWHHTDLPGLSVPPIKQGPLLSPQALLELVRHLGRRGKASSATSKRRSSR